MKINFGSTLMKRIARLYKKMRNLIIEVKPKDMIQDLLNVVSLFNEMPNESEKKKEGPFIVTQRIELSRAKLPEGLVNHKWFAKAKGNFDLPNSYITLADEPAVTDDIDAFMIAEAKIAEERQASYKALKQFSVKCIRDMKNAKTYEEILAVLDRMGGAAFGHIHTTLLTNFDKDQGENIFISAYRIGRYLQENTALESDNMKFLGLNLEEAARKYVYVNRKGVPVLKDIEYSDITTQEDFAKIKAAINA